MPIPKKTHHIFKTFLEGANGHRSEPVEERLHISRNCRNCSANGRNDPDWVAGGGIEKFGVCQNGCSAAENSKSEDQWCFAHSTKEEFEAGRSRIDRPVLTLVQGGAL